jgi:hypothetical protein
LQEKEPAVVKAPVSPPKDPRSRRDVKPTTSSTSQQLAVVHPTKPAEKKTHMARRGGISVREGRMREERIKEEKRKAEESRSPKGKGRRNYRASHASESDEEPVPRKKSRSPRLTPPLPAEQPNRAVEPKKEPAPLKSALKRATPPKDAPKERPPAKKAKKADDSLPEDLA